MVCNPEELRPTSDGGGLETQEGYTVDFVYNRTTDFRFTDPRHAHLRVAATQNIAQPPAVVVSPHPAAYSRIADKRLLTRLQHVVVPESAQMTSRPMDYWLENRKRYVFKPPDTAASKGVYRGDKISASKLRDLPPSTIAQEFCPPAYSEDGSKFDVRVFCHGSRIMGIASRHFSGQVMELRSALSGFKAALPETACCFTVISVM